VEELAQICKNFVANYRFANFSTGKKAFQTYYVLALKNLFEKVEIKI
jgi:hypothetical protein